MNLPSVVLASGSATRKGLLERSGVDVDVRVPGIDEAVVTESLIRDQVKPEDIAVRLAELKALRVGSREPEHVVVGCDQVLWSGGRMFHKAGSIDEARNVLLELRGRSHSLVSAAVAVIGGARTWHAISRAELVMRDFSDSFLESYLARNWPRIKGSVGCYRLEEEGVQLMARVRGDLFAIMGMPLIELLEYLRVRGVVPR